MQYHHKYKNKRRAPLVISVSILLAVVLLRYFAPNFTGNIVMFFATPFMKGSGSVGTASASVFDLFSSKQVLQDENNALKAKISELQVVQDRDKLLEQENSELKELLGRHSDNNSVLASVISKPPMSVYDTIVLDIGADKKISVGDNVLALGVVPIGSISAVYSHTSIVKLYSSQGEQIDVSVGKNIQTTAQALGGGNFIIKLPKGSKVQEGDPIAAPGIAADIFGSVKSIETNENEPFVYIRFNLPVNMEELNFVQVDRTSAI